MTKYSQSLQTGIDTVIGAIQDHLYNNLSCYKMKGYGRIYRNIKNGTTKAEFYLDNGEYQDVYFDDDFDGVFFFIDDMRHTTDDELTYKSGVKCVFMLNLDKMYSETDRADQSAHKEMIGLLTDRNYVGYKIKNLEIGVDTVMVGFDRSQIKLSDIHPYHCFSIGIDLSYYFNC